MLGPKDQINANMTLMSHPDVAGLDGIGGFLLNTALRNLFT